MADKKVLTGIDAFESFNEDSDSGESNEFTPFKSGSKYVVKIPELTFITEYVYGIFKQTNSFIAENPSKKSAKGYPIEDLTPFDLAWKHFKDQSEDFRDKMNQEAGKYKCSKKATIGFYDLDTGEPMKVEFTWNQAQAVVEVIKKNEKRLDQFAFELEKNGSGRDTIVSLTLIPVMDDLTDKQRENFEKLPNDFDPKYLKGLHYAMSDEEQIETLTRVGFDVSLIGLDKPEDAPKTDEAAKEAVTEEGGESIDITDDDLPF